MLTIERLEDLRGNNVTVYSIRTLIDKHTYPHFSIMAGHMGVGKSSAAKLVAQEIDKTGSPVMTFNFGLEVKMIDVEEQVFKLNPNEPKVFIFEEMQGLDKSQQTALLTMLDRQPSNVYIIGTTTESYKLLKTIQSRATIWPFRLLGEKQLAQLLEDYLKEAAYNMSPTAKLALLKAARGVPRDLLKNADLAISGEFTGEQLNELLGQVSDDLMFTMLCSLKVSSVDFATNMSALIEGSGKDKLYQMRDFYTRYLLERKGIEGATLSKEKLTTLDSLFSDEERSKIGRCLIRATGETLALELSILNMELVGTTKAQMVGQQIDRIATQQASAVSTVTKDVTQARKSRAKLTASDLSAMKLD